MSLWLGIVGSVQSSYSELTLIQRVSLSSTESSITFSNIPQTYDSLHLRIIARGDASVNRVTIPIRPNNDSNNNYSSHYFLGNGDSSSSGSAINQSYPIYCAVMPCALYNSNIYGLNILNISNYSSNIKNKTIISISGSENRSSGSGIDRGFSQISSALWMSSSPITSLVITGAGSNFIQGTTISLYGVGP